MISNNMQLVYHGLPYFEAKLACETWMNVETLAQKPGWKGWNTYVIRCSSTYCYCGILYDTKKYLRSHIWAWYSTYIYIHIHTHHIPIFRCPFFKRLPRLSNRCRNSGKRDPQLAPSMSGSTRLSFLPVSVTEGWRVGSRSESLGWCT